LIELK